MFSGGRNLCTPDTPWTLIVYDDTMEAEEGYRYIQVATTGADSRRRITLREKDGQYTYRDPAACLSGLVELRRMIFREKIS